MRREKHRLSGMRSMESKDLMRKPPYVRTGFFGAAPEPQRSQIVLRNDRGSAHAIFRVETAFPPNAPFRSPREHKTERKRPFWAAPAIRRRFSGNSFAENLYNHLGATQKQGFCGECVGCARSAFIIPPGVAIEKRMKVCYA